MCSSDLSRVLGSALPLPRLRPGKPTGEPRFHEPFVMALKGIKTNTQKQTMKQNKKQKMYRTNGKYKIRQIITKTKELTHTTTTKKKKKEGAKETGVKRK